MQETRGTMSIVQRSVVQNLLLDWYALSIWSYAAVIRRNVALLKSENNNHAISSIKEAETIHEKRLFSRQQVIQKNQSFSYPILADKLTSFNFLIFGFLLIFNITTKKCYSKEVLFVVRRFATWR